MSNKVSTCLYIDKGVLETAHRVGLNVSKVAEDALIEAIDNLLGTKPETGPKSPSPGDGESQGWDLNLGARLYRSVGY